MRSEVAGPEVLFPNPVLEWLDQCLGRLVGLVERRHGASKVEVERLDLLLHEPVDPVQFLLELRFDLEIDRHRGLRVVRPGVVRNLPCPFGRFRIQESGWARSDGPDQFGGPSGQVQNDPAERFHPRVVGPPVYVAGVPAFEHDGQFEPGEDDVIVDVVDIAT